MDDTISRAAKIEERKEELAQNVPKEDLISRKAALDVMNGRFETLKQAWGDEIRKDGVAVYLDMRGIIEALPSEQPKLKKGKWIERNPQNSNRCRLIECDQCGFSHIVGFNVPYEYWIGNRNFCERCGAYMGGSNGKNT